VAGEADVLVFPNIECAKIFYKALMLIAAASWPPP
jgi:phosphotransacetylase